VKEIRATIEELRIGVTGRTGDAYRIVVPPRVVLELSWDESLIDLLSQDAVLRLHSQYGMQDRPLRDAVRRDGEVVVGFSWRGPSLPTSLDLIVAGRAHTLWKDRAVGIAPPEPWEVDLSACLEQVPDEADASQEITASLPETEGPIDERVA
jgi:hypothetical protein